MSKQAARWLQIIITGFVGVVLTTCAIPGQEAPAAQSTATVQTKWKTLSGQAPLVIAHRGASGERPEHTLEAYDLAIDQGADFIEPDLVITKDGQLVARHDRYLSGSTNVSELEEFADRKVIKPGKAQADWYVEDFTLAELKTLRARQPRDGRSKAYDDKHEIPTFEDVLQLVVDRSEETGRRIGIYPETKQPAALEALGFSFNAPLLAALKRHGYDGADDPVFIQSFEVENLKRLNTKTDVRLVYLIAHLRLRLLPMVSGLTNCWSVRTASLPG